MGRPKMKSSLFFFLLCLFQINKLGFCLEEEAQKSKNGVGSNGFISVTSFGAIGDGETDDTKAFLKAWEAVCKGGRNTKILVPQGKTFMLKPLAFIGPCKSSSISFSAMHFNNCNGLRISNLRHLNSPRNHVGLSCSQNIEVTGIRMTAPGDSPNTDGIDISNCKGVHIHDSVIATGDDCIAINSGSSHINITGIFCGPGHGISVGSLGVTGDFATVEEVRVKNCTFTNTQNGVRIKTYQNGSGYARKISFEDIIMVASENPIIIDQTYHNGGTNGGRSKSSNSYQNCHLAAKQRTQSGNGKGVRVSDVRYSSIRGSSASDQAITLNCDADLGCSDIVMNNVNMVSATFGHKVFATCKNAHGSFFASKVNCLKKY